MKKLFVLLIKYMPTIQLVGMLVNNTLYKYDVNLEFDYIGDFLHKEIIKGYNIATIPQGELLEAIKGFHEAFDYVEDHNKAVLY